MRILHALLLLAVAFALRAEAKFVDDQELLTYSVNSGLVNAAFAKELCSCHFVAGLPPRECVRRANLPAGAEQLISWRVIEANEEVDDAGEPVPPSVIVKSSLVARTVFWSRGPEAVAVHEPGPHGRFGCRLTRGPLDARK